jgi:hypothetical protein
VVMDEAAAELVEAMNAVKEETAAEAGVAE